MKVLFLSIGGFESINSHDQYPDLLREFIKNNHEVYVVCSTEKRFNQNTKLVEEGNSHVLHVRIGNITKSNFLEKGISTIMISYLYKIAIKKYFNDVKFDLILYTTPPISLFKIIKHLKYKYNAFTYLILKDIFPQNAVDLGILNNNFITKIIYKYFRTIEKKLYRISDKIGVMSDANKKYILKNNSYINNDKVEICPNCVYPILINLSIDDRVKIRKKYDLPLDKKIFVYGGNLGKPQDIKFVLKCIKNSTSISNAFFWIIGDGTDYQLVRDYIDYYQPSNLKLTKRLNKNEFDYIIASCDVGLIFLDYRFTIPNFPSRMLAYMQAGLPILSCTDRNTDIGDIICNNNFGWKCYSNDIYGFTNLVRYIVDLNLEEYINNSRLHIMDYTSDKCYNIIYNSYIKMR